MSSILYSAAAARLTLSKLRPGPAGREPCLVLPGRGQSCPEAFPVIRQTVLDTTDPRRLVEFYRQLSGLRYRPGDEPPAVG